MADWGASTQNPISQKERRCLQELWLRPDHVRERNTNIQKEKSKGRDMNFMKRKEKREKKSISVDQLLQFFD